MIVHIPKFFLLPLFAAAFVCGYGQTSVTDFEKVAETYRRLNGFSANLEYIVFRGHQGDRAVTVQTGSFRTDMKNAYVLKIGDVVQFHNAGYDILVSGEENVMAVKTNPGRKPIPVFAIDTSGGLWKKAVKVSEGNGLRTWRVKFADPQAEYEQMDIVLDTRQYLIRSLSLYYRQKMGAYLASEEPEDDYRPKLSIHYQNVVLNPVFPADEFSEKKFIRYSDGNMKPATRYQNFELIIRNP